MRTNGQLCDRARQWMSRRVDDELSELENAFLDAHLARCAGCRRFAADVTAVAAALRGAAVESPRPVVLDLPPRTVGRRGAGIVIAAALVVAAALLGAGVRVVDRSQRHIAAPRPTAMIAMDDSLDQLRRIRRPILITRARPIARHWLSLGE
jgi:anti-sigma factor RsiW